MPRLKQSIQMSHLLNIFGIAKYQKPKLKAMFS